MVRWVREELHRWIYDNLRAKWATVRRWAAGWERGGALAQTSKPSVQISGKDDVNEDTPGLATGLRAGEHCSGLQTTEHGVYLMYSHAQCALSFTPSLLCVDRAHHTCRKPSRLAELFSGYHAPRALVYEVSIRHWAICSCLWHPTRMHVSPVTRYAVARPSTYNHVAFRPAGIHLTWNPESVFCHQMMLTCTAAVLCTSTSVPQVLDKVGLPPSVLSSDAAAPLLAAWGEADLHRLVATFLCVRFPVGGSRVGVD
jgi:hypothetical protein